ncbi:pentapeptide repeat-containing protein [Patescibacteria group bacterium]
MKNSVFQKLKTKDRNTRVKFSLKKCTFEKTDLSRAVFVKCDLKNVSFAESLLKDAVFDSCWLEEAVFRGADIAGCGFENCKIDKTVLDMNSFLQYGRSKGFVFD